MRVFGLGSASKRNWLKEAIRDFASEQEETYNASTSGKANVKPISTLIEAQIEYLFKQLSKEDQRWIIDFAEEQRKEAGPIMSRQSDNYFYKVARSVVNFVLDQELGIKHLVKKDWQNFQKIFFAYHPDNKTILKIDRSLAIQPDQNVYLVTEEKTNIKWVMKWESTDPKQKENAEAAEYNKLESMGAQCPKRLNGYYFLNFPVLIIEFLQPLDSTDNVIELARQLLITQLKYIHQYACYFDLKPDNIRKRASDNPPKYFIIDMNLSHTALPGGGYARQHWTPLFSSQTFPRAPYSGLQFSNYKNDFIELLYVIHQMIAQRAYEAKMYSFKDEERTFGKNFYGLLSKDFFADPERMNKDPIITTARGWKAAKALLEYPLPDSNAVITLEYIRYVNVLPNFPPPNVHEILFSTLEYQSRSYNRFLKETKTTLSLQCQICSQVSQFRCGECYHGCAFLCSSLCAKKHVCK